MNFKSNKFLSGVKNLLDTNAPTIATFGSIDGVGLTIFFMHKASKAAATVEEKYEEKVEWFDNKVEDGEMKAEDAKEEKARSKMDKAMRLVYIYRWALLSGIGSAGFALLSNYLNGRTIAALTGFVALNNERIREYAKKGKEMLGEEKFKELQDNVEKELFDKKVKKGDIKPERSKSLVSDSAEPEDGCVRYFVPGFDWIWEVPAGRMNDVLAEAQRMEYLNMNDLRNMLGLPSCKWASPYCWDEGNPFKAHIGYSADVGTYGMKTISFDNEPGYDPMRNRA